MDWKGGGRIRLKLVECSVPSLYMSTKLLVKVPGLVDKLCLVVEVFYLTTVSIDKAPTLNT
jgi:hypothetical protein